MTEKNIDKGLKAINEVTDRYGSLSFKLGFILMAYISLWLVSIIIYFVIYLWFFDSVPIVTIPVTIVLLVSFIVLRYSINEIIYLREKEWFNHLKNFEIGKKFIELEKKSRVKEGYFTDLIDSCEEIGKISLYYIPILIILIILGFYLNEMVISYILIILLVFIPISNRMSANKVNKLKERRKNIIQEYDIDEGDDIDG